MYHFVRLFRATDGSWRINAALLVIEAMKHSDAAFQVVRGAGLRSILIELMSFEDPLPIEFALRILYGCPTKHRKQLLLESGFAAKLVSFLRYELFHRDRHIPTDRVRCSMII